MDVSIVVPCFNEAGRLYSTLDTLGSFLTDLGREYEIIICDDGSTDETATLDWLSYSERYRAKYLRSLRHEGKGAAVRSGLREAKGDYSFAVDADLSVALDALPVCLDILEDNQADVVTGDRRLPESTATSRAPIGRRIASRAFNTWVQILLLPGFTDTQCPMKGFRRSVIKRLIEETILTSFAFDVEILYLAQSSGLRIERIPIAWMDTRKRYPIGELISLVLTNMVDVVRIRNASLKS